MLRIRGLPLGRIKAIHAVAVFFAVAILLYTLSFPSVRRRPAVTVTEGRTAPWREWDKKKAADDEARYLRDLVRRHSLSPNPTFFSRRIRPDYGRGLGGASAANVVAGGKPPPSMTDAGVKLSPRGGFARPRLDDPDLSLGRHKKPIALPLSRSPFPDSVDASSLIFGIATTHARVSYADFSALHDWRRWLTDGRGKSNGATLVLVLHGAPSTTDVTRVAEKLRALGVDATVSAPEKKKDDAGDRTVPSGPGARYAELLALLNKRNEELLQRPDGDDAASEGAGDGKEVKKQDTEKRSSSGKKEKRIVALVDDDVFFPSMAWLTRRLARFPLDGEWYVGAPSDRQGDWAVLDDSGRAMTYGGGAVFLSPRVAEEASQLPCMASSQADDSSSSSSTPWDEHLYRCVDAHTQHRLHVLPSLYAPATTAESADARRLSSSFSEQPQRKHQQQQKEISNDEVGFGSGQQALALHHYRNYHQFDAGKGHEVSSICGEACFLQRFRFSDGWVLVNGCSLSHYPDGMEVVPLLQGGHRLGGRGGSEAKDLWENGPVLADERLVMEDTREEGGAGDALLADAKVVAWRGRRQTWRLLDSAMVNPESPGGGQVWQAYVKRRGFLPDPWAPKGDAPLKDGVHEDADPEPEDSIVLLIWEAAQ